MSGRDVWSIIFHYLPISVAKEWALLSKSMYYASRMGSARNMRWTMMDVIQLNTLTTSFFAHLIEAVKIKHYFALTCLYHVNAKITDIEMHIASNLHFIGENCIDFDRITKLAFYFDKSVKKYAILELPDKLTSLKCIGNGDPDITIPSDLPNSLKMLAILNCEIKNIHVPDGLEELVYRHKFCYQNMPIVPLNIKKISMIGNDVAGWQVFGANTVYPNLEYMLLTVNGLKSDSTITVDTGNFPSLKYIEVTKLDFLNSARLYVNKMYKAGDSDIVVIEEKEEENICKKIKRNE